MRGGIGGKRRGQHGEPVLLAKIEADEFVDDVAEPGLGTGPEPRQDIPDRFRQSAHPARPLKRNQ